MSDPTTSQSPPPLVSLVIVTYNGREHLRACLESVFALDYPVDRVEVLVVDNGSSDGSEEDVRERFPRVMWLRNDANNYCRANNLAVSQTKGAVIGFVNNDVRLDRRWLQELLPVLDMDERIGAVGGKTLLREGVLNSTGHVEFPHGMWADRGHQEPEVGQFDLGGAVEGLSGSAVLYRRRCLDDIGPFDEDFHMYYEDIDLAYRCKQQGWKLLYVPGARAYHAFHGTASESFVEQQTARNRMLLLAKHAPERLAAALAVSLSPEPSSAHAALGVLRHLPDLVNKLIKHHGVDGLARWLPGITEEIGKIVQRDRHFLASRLEHEREHARRMSAELDEAHRVTEALRDEVHREQVERGQAGARAEERRAECDRLWSRVKELEERLGRELQAAVQAQQMLAEKAAELDRVHAAWRGDQAALVQAQDHAHALERTLHSHVQELEQVRRELTNLEQSTAHRFLVRPLWVVLVVLRRPIGLWRPGERRQRGTVRSRVREAGSWVVLGALAVGFILLVWLPLWCRKRFQRPR